MAERTDDLAAKASAVRALVRVLEVPCAVHEAKPGEWCDPAAPGVCAERIVREQRTRPARERAAERKRWRDAFALRRHRAVTDARRNAAERVRLAALIHVAALHAVDATQPTETSTTTERNDHGTLAST